VNGILTISDGRPFSITFDGPRADRSGRISRANCFGDAVPGRLRSDHRSSGFDTTKFAEPAALTYGTSRRTPSSSGFEVDEPVALPIDSVQRQQRLELRLESFNTFNWINYGRPGQSVSECGDVREDLVDAGRSAELQFAVKLYF